MPGLSVDDSSHQVIETSEWVCTGVTARGLHRALRVQGAFIKTASTAWVRPSPAEAA
jgi:hypothetical protein